MRIVLFSTVLIYRECPSDILRLFCDCLNEHTGGLIVMQDFVLHFHVCVRATGCIHRVVFILHFHEKVQLLVHDIETTFVSILRHFPTTARIFENVLVKVANSVVVCLVNLAQALSLNSLPDSLTVDFGIESQFYRVDNVLVEAIEIDVPPILQHSCSDMLIYVFVGDEAEIVVAHIRGLRVLLVL